MTRLNIKLSNLVLLFLVLLCSCRKYDTKINEEPLPELKSTFTGIIDGRRVTWKADSVGYIDTSFVFSEIFPDSSFNSYVSGLEKPGRVRIEFIRKRLGYVGVAPSQFDFRNYFLPGNYSYAYSPPTYVTNGFTIAYAEGGLEFTTEGVGANQSPTTFRIVSQQDGLNKRGNYQVNVVCKFSCNLYQRNDLSNIKVITQGEFRGSFIYQN